MRGLVNRYSQPAIEAAALEIMDDFAAARARVPDFDDIDAFPEDERPIYLSEANIHYVWWDDVDSDTLDVMAAIIEQANAEGWYPADFLPNGGDAELIALAQEIEDFVHSLYYPSDDTHIAILRNSAGVWRAEMIHTSDNRCDPNELQVRTKLRGLDVDQLGALNDALSGLALADLADDAAVYVIFQELAENHGVVTPHLDDPEEHLHNVYEAEREQTYGEFGYAWRSWDEITQLQSAPAVKTAELPNLEGIDKPAPSSGHDYAP